MGLQALDCSDIFSPVGQTRLNIFKPLRGTARAFAFWGCDVTGSKKKFDDRRGSSAKRGYGYKWQKAREAYLSKHPLCKMHAELGRVVPAVVVDHIEPHRGDMVKFWDSKNWQSLCKTCHDGVKQRIEKSGVVPGCSLTGIPFDPNHHWAKAKS